MITGNYDLIGDIHGHAEVLRRLLRVMDYRDDDGVFRHPDRRVIFVGDFIDRGPEQREVLHIAKSMYDAGTALAVMGNHEFNALGWAEPDGNGGFLRPHSQKNKEQHEEFLCQIGEGSTAHKEALEWFKRCRFGWICPGYASCTLAGTPQLSECFSHFLTSRRGSPKQVYAKQVAGVPKPIMPPRFS